MKAILQNILVPIGYLVFVAAIFFLSYLSFYSPVNIGGCIIDKEAILAAIIDKEKKEKLEKASYDIDVLQEPGKDDAGSWPGIVLIKQNEVMGELGIKNGLKSLRDRGWIIISVVMTSYDPQTAAVSYRLPNQHISTFPSPGLRQVEMDKLHLNAQNDSRRSCAFLGRTPSWNHGILGLPVQAPLQDRGRIDFLVRWPPGGQGGSLGDRTPGDQPLRRQREILR